MHKVKFTKDDRIECTGMVLSEEEEQAMYDVAPYLVDLYRLMEAINLRVDHEHATRWDFNKMIMYDLCMSIEDYGLWTESLSFCFSDNFFVDVTIDLSDLV